MKFEKSFSPTISDVAGLGGVAISTGLSREPLGTVTEKVPPVKFSGLMERVFA